MSQTLSGPMFAPLSGSAPKQIVVLLHGYGSNGDDLIGLAPSWRPILPDGLFVSPNAHQPVPGYPAGFQWFAIDFDGDRLASRVQGLPLAAPVLVQFLQDLWAQTGLGAKDTIVAGFSQGAMMALHVGLSLREPLMGIIAFSGALVPPPGFGNADLPKPPVCIVHGDSDQVVEPALGEEAYAALVAAGYDVRYHVSRGVGHGISPDGLEFASDFIRAISTPQTQIDNR